MKLKQTKINKNISLLSNQEKGEYFPKFIFDETENDIYKWFAPDNNYPAFVISEIRKGTTLDSILFEDLIYKTGSGFSTVDKTFDAYLKDEDFKSTFKKTNDSFSKLGNVFVELVLGDDDSLISISVLQPQKCRITKKNKVVIHSDWQNYKSSNSVEIPIYPKKKTFTKKGIKFKKSIFIIKNEAVGFDHYGINEKLHNALVLNEKEYRRLNWQNNQIKRGFKRDFLFVTDFAQTEKEKEKQIKHLVK